MREIGNPLVILQIGLPPRQSLHLRRIGEQQLELPFQYVPHRFPIHACGFHCHMAHWMALQPVRKPQKLRGRGAPAQLVLVAFASLFDGDAHRQTRLMYSIPQQRA